MDYLSERAIRERGKLGVHPGPGGLVPHGWPRLSAVPVRYFLVQPPTPQSPGTTAARMCQQGYAANTLDARFSDAGCARLRAQGGRCDAAELG
jgi:hypothetical protein